MKVFKSILTIMMLLSMIVVVGCSDDDNNPISNNSNVEPTLDIVETAAANGNFTTLLAAAEAAGLVEALKSEGPITVFAPTDEAFAKLPVGTVDALLADTAALTAILLYHVADGAVKAEQVVNLATVPTLNGAELTITVTNNSVMIDNANITITDIETSNGIIHVIDAVVIPTATSSSIKDGAQIYATGFWFGSYRFGGGWVANAIKNGKLKWLTKRLSLYYVARLTGLNTLTTAVKAAGLKSTLKYGGPFTVFGPTDEAFGNLPEGTIPALLNDIPTLTDILLYHVVPAKVTSSQVVNLTEATMANGGTVAISVVDGGVKINESNVIVVDIPARNGVIHLLDNVLLP